MRRRVPVLAGVGLLAMPAAASAAAPQAAPARTDLTTRPGRSVTVAVAVRDVTACTLAAGGRRITTSTPPGATQARFTFRVSRRVRPGRHRLVVRCPPVPARVVNLRVVRSHGRSRSAIRGTVRVQVRSAPVPPPVASSTPLLPIGAAAAPLSRFDAYAQAQAWWAALPAAWLASWRNGQCTDWADRRRHDIVVAAFIDGYAKRLMGDPDALPMNWAAMYWDDHARAAGLPVSSTPEEGAISVQEPGADGADPAVGHVAYVEHVFRDGSFRVSEMNAPVLGRVTRRTITLDAARRAGYSFIGRLADRRLG